MIFAIILLHVTIENVGDPFLEHTVVTVLVFD